MKIRATVIHQDNDWVTARLEIKDEDGWTVFGIRPQVYTAAEWTTFLGIMILGCRLAKIEFEESYV